MKDKESAKTPRERTFTDEEERIINAGVKELVHNNLKGDVSAALKGDGEAAFLEGKIMNSVADSKSFAESLRETRDAKKEKITKENTDTVVDGDDNSLASRRRSDSIDVKGKHTQDLKNQALQEEAMDKAKCGAACTIM